MIARIATAVVVLTLIALPAHAERLIVSVSNHRVTVTSNYIGEELVLFGSVEKDADTPPDRTGYDLVVTVSGPRTDMVTRRKERKFGIWINTDSRQFLKVPSYLAVFANRPLEAIAPGQRVTVSVGVAEAADVDTADTLLSRADAALYAAKRAGRGTWRLSLPD